MDFREYVEDTIIDARNFCDENADSYDDFDEMWDDLTNSDDVTGNLSGSYTFNSFAAQQNVKDVLVDQEFWAEMEGIDCQDMVCEWLRNKDYESIDVIARYCAVQQHYCEIEDRFNDAKSKDEE